MTGAHKQESGSRLVGEREERLRERVAEAIARAAERGPDVWERLSGPARERYRELARAALASSPSPPDRELLPDPYVCQRCHRFYPYLDLMGDPQCECGSDKFFYVPNGEEVERSLRAALFGRGDDEQ